MKCSDFEKEVYLYNELTALERAEMDAHISTCTHCTQLFNAVREMHKIVGISQRETPQLRHHAAMTRRIMDAVGETQRRKHAPLRDVFRRLIASPLRHHMAVLSILLVVCFVREYGSEGEHLKIVKQHPGVGGTKTELNLAAFHTVFFETKKENNQSSRAFSDCVALCLDASTSECESCAEKFAKP